MITLDKSGRLMTVAELMAATGWGQTSVCKALNELEREDNVRRSPRKTAGRAELCQTSTV
jgi:DNA-binding GntR family transcriptional regulator